MNIFKKNKTATKAGLMIFIVLMTSMIAFAGTASATTHYVNASNETGYTTVQAAINAADNYDTIIVLDGTYNENIEVNKSISLIAYADDALIKSNSSELPVINVTANDVIIDGFNVDANNTSSSGIFVLEADNVTIQNNEVFNATTEGLPEHYYSGSSIPAEEWARVDYSLIVILNCSDITVDNNILSDAFAGVGYASGENIYITDNEISKVNRGIKSCLFRNNTYNSTRGGYDYSWNYETGTGLYITDNTISDIGDKGIEVMSDDAIVSGNTIENISFVNVPNPNENYQSRTDGLVGIKAGCEKNGIVNCTITNNIITDIHFDKNENALLGDISQQTGIKLSNVTDGLVQNNDVSSIKYVNDFSENFDMQRGIQISLTENCVINSNSIHSFYMNDTETYGQIGIMIGKKAFNSSVTNNIVSDMYLINTSTHKQNGIRISLKGSGDIEGNTVTSLHAINSSVYQQTGIVLKNGCYDYEDDEHFFVDEEDGYVGNSDGRSISNNAVSDIIIHEGSDSDFQAGIAVQFGVNNTILNNEITKVNTSTPTCMYAGLFVGEGDNCTIVGNTIEEGLMGLALKYSDDCTVSGNTIKNAAYGGMFVYYSENNLIYNNYFKNEENIIFRPPFEANMDIMREAISNQWSITKTAGTNIVGGPYLGGNYWVHPNGTGFSVDTADSNEDGICDKQYNVSETEFDYFPLAPAPAPAPVEKKSSSGSRAYVGPSQPPEYVQSTDSSVLRVNGGERVEYDFGTSQGPVLGISFDSKEDKGLVAGNVQVLKDVPEDVGDHPDGIPYKVMSITLGHAGTISEETADNIIINFKVSWEWVKENNIDLSTIRLMRFHDGQWQELPTVQMSDDGEFLQFTAQTPGFSVFSIVGDEASEAGSDESVAAEDATEVASEPEEASTESTPGFTMLFSTALLAIAAVVIRGRN